MDESVIRRPPGLTGEALRARSLIGAMPRDTRRFERLPLLASDYLGSERGRSLLFRDPLQLGDLRGLRFERRERGLRRRELIGARSRHVELVLRAFLRARRCVDDRLGRLRALGCGCVIGEVALGVFE